MSTRKQVTDTIKRIAALPECPQALLILSPDAIRIERVLEHLFKKFSGGTFTRDKLIRLNLEELKSTHFAKVKNSLSSISLFSSEQHLILENVHELTAPESKVLLVIIEESSPSNKIFITGEKLLESNALSKYFAGKELLIHLEELKGYDLRQWVEKEFERNNVKKVSPEALVLMMELGENLPDKIAPLVKHLSLYLSDEEASVKDINAVFLSKTNSSEFELIDAISTKNVGRAEVLLSQIMKEGKSPFALIGLIAKTFSQYALIKNLQDHKKRPEEIRSLLGIQSWLFSKYSPAASRFSSEQLIGALKRILRIDGQLKNRSIGPEAIFGALVHELSLKKTQ